MMNAWRLVIGMALMGLLSTATYAADEPPRVIKPEEARKHVGKKCSVTFLVQRTKHSEKRKRWYLDSEEDFNDEKNLGIQIEESGAKLLREKKNVDDPATYYLKKSVRVVGKVFLEDERPYIRVDDPDQIDVVEKK